MDGPGPLGEFLQARRAHTRPEDIGVQDFGARRRVQGLRRDEVAHLAGVSVSYYTRLEQGISRGASPKSWMRLPLRCGWIRTNGNTSNGWPTLPGGHLGRGVRGPRR